MRTLAAIVIAATMTGTPVSAIDFTQALINPDGQPYKRCAKPDPGNPAQCAKDGFVDQTLGRLVIDALNIIDQSLGNDGIVARGLLAFKVRDAHDLELTDKERDTIKAALLASYTKAGVTPTAIVQALRVIDPAAVKEK